MSANVALVDTGWWSTIEAFHVIVWAIQPGFPRATPRNMPLSPSDPGVNMKGWI